MEDFVQGLILCVVFCILFYINMYLLIRLVEKVSKKGNFPSGKLVVIIIMASSFAAIFEIIAGALFLKSIF